MGRKLDELLGGSSQSPQEDHEIPGGLSALQDPYFLARLRRYYRDYRNQSFASDAEMIDAFRTDQVWKQWNIGRTAWDWATSLNDRPDERALKRDIEAVGESIPYRAEDIGTAVGAAILDPTNLIGLGGVGKGVQVLRQTGRMGEAMKAAAKSGALREGAVNAGIAGVADMTEQAQDVEIGLRDETSLLEAGVTGAVGGAVGGAIGGGLAAAGTGLFGRKTVAKQIEILSRLGYQPDQIAALTQRDVNNIISKGIQAPPPVRAEGEGEDDLDRAYADAMAPPKDGETPEGDADAPGLERDKQLELDRIDLHIIQVDEALRALKRETPGEREMIDAHNQYLDDLYSVRALAQRINNAHESVLPTLEGNDLKAERAAQARLRRIRDLNHLYQDVLDDPSPERVRRLVAQSEEVLGPAEGAPSSGGQAASDPTSDASGTSKVPEASDAQPEQPGAELPADGGGAARPAEGASGKRGRKTNSQRQQVAAHAERLWNDVVELAPTGDKEGWARAIRSQPDALRRLLELDDDVPPELKEVVWDRITKRYLSPEKPPRGAPAAEAIEGISEKERLWIAAQATIEKRKDPSISDDEAKLRATAFVLAQRRPSGAGVADPVLKGRNPDGKVQGILKPGKWAGEGRSVTDGPAPRVLKKDRGKADGHLGGIKAAREFADRNIVIDADGKPVLRKVDDFGKPIDAGRTKSVEAGMLVQYRSHGGESVTRAVFDPAKKRAQPGEVLWYDKFSKTSYETPELVKPGQTFDLPSPEERKRRKLQASQERAKQRVLDAEAEAHQTLQEKIKSATSKEELIAILAGREVEKRAAELPEVPVTIDGNMVLALRNKANPEMTRVMSPNQVAAGKRLVHLLGTGSLDDWEVGHTVGSSNSKQAARSFKPFGLGDAEIADLAPPAERLTISLEESYRPVELNDDQRKKFEGILSDFEKVRLIPGLFTKDKDGKRQAFDIKKAFEYYRYAAANDKLAPWDLYWIETTINSMAEWGTARQHRNVVSTLTRLYELIGEVAPARVQYSTLSYEESVGQLVKVGSKYDPRDVNETIRLLRTMVEQNDGRAPHFQADSSSFNHGISPPNGSTIGMLPHGSIMTPNVATILHELGHWAYANILSPAEKLHFWRSMEKYYNEDGSLNRDLVASKTPGEGKYGPLNEMASPQEFFANQFSMWAMQNRASVAVQDENFWKRVSRYVVNLYKRYFSREVIDEDLVPLFDAILPDRSTASDNGTPDVLKPETRQGVALVNRFTQFREAVDDLHTALISEDPDVIIAAAEQARNQFYGIATFKTLAYSKTHPVGALAFRMSRMLGEAISTSGSQDDIATMIRAITVEAPDGKTFNLDDAYNFIHDQIIAKFNGQPNEKIILAKDGVTFLPKPKSNVWRERIKRRRNAQEVEFKNKMEEVVNEANALVATDRPARDLKLADISADNIINIKSASMDNLMLEWERWSDTDYGLALANELNQRGKALPLDLKAERIHVKDQRILSAISRERRDYQGIASEDGAAPAARATIREAQSYLTHRDGEYQLAMRTIFYRLANIAGLTDHNAQTVLSTDFIAKLTGREPDQPGRVFADHKSSEFSALRSHLRHLAKRLNGTSDDGVLKDVARMVMRTGVIDDQGLIARTIGEDEFIETLSRYFQNQEGAFPAVPEALQLRRLAVQYQDAVAYVTNGMVGSNDIKARHPNIDNYGSVFGETRDWNPRHYRLKGEAPPSELVPNDARVAWEQAGLGRRRAILDFVKDGLGSDGKRPVPFYLRVRNDVVDDDMMAPVVETDFGPGVRAYTDPTGPNVDMIDRVLDYVLQKHGPDGDEFLAASDEAAYYMDTVDEVIRAETRLADIEARRLELGEAYFTEASDARRAVSHYQDELAAIVKDLKSLVPRHILAQPSDHAVYVRVRNPLDLSEVVPNDHPIFRSFAEYAWNEGLITDAEKLERLADTLATPGEMTGREAYHLLTSTLQDGPSEYPQLAALTNQVLEALGYDAIISPHIEKQVIIFNPENVKSTTAKSFIDTPHLFGPISEMQERLGSINTAIIANAKDGPTSLAPAAEMMERAGLPPELSAAMSAVWKKRRLSAREQKVIRAASLGDVFLAPNSVRMRKAGMRYLADFISPEFGTGHFERIASETARLVDPLTRAMTALPDVRKGIQGYWDRRFVEVATNRQPASHARIVGALRRKDGGKNLSAEERKVHDLTREMFADLHSRLKAAGVMIGEIKDNYFPQVWKIDHILNNQDKFVSHMGVYLMREAEREGRELDHGEALIKARGIFDNLVNDDGVFIPPAGTSGNEIIGDHIDYQRLIRLDQDEKALDLLEEFLESNLGAITTKYVDTAVRKLDFVNRFGQGGHGWFDYLAVFDMGDAEAARLLTTNRITEKAITGIDGENNKVEFTLRREAPMPFHGRPGEARNAINVARSLLASGGVPAARDYLISLMPPGGDDAGRTYIRRVDAIVNAMADRDSSNVIPHASELEHARKVFRVIQRKPIETAYAASQAATRASRALRNFNSVTLLSWTVLSSLGDLVLPAVKSGRLDIQAKAWAEYARDPIYRQMLKNVGVVVENTIHERMVGLYGSGIAKTTQMFFNGTGLTPWTETMRQLSGAVGYEWFKAEYKRAWENFDPRKPVTDQNKNFKQAYRHLRQYGIDHLLLNNTPIDTPTALADNDELRQAIIKFANRTVFTPNPDDLPVAAQTPIGSVLYQLKSFPIMMMRMSRDVLRESGLWWTPERQADGTTKWVNVPADERDIRPLLVLAIAAPAFASQVNRTKDIVQGRGGEDGNEHKPRERYATDIAIIGDALKAAGWDENDKSAWNAFLGEYLEGIMMMGGLGLLGDMIHDSAQQLDNGAYGATRIASTIFGPSVGDFFSAINVVAGAADALGGNESNAKERQAVREIIQRIPVVGGIKSRREDAVDFLAGEANFE